MLSKQNMKKRKLEKSEIAKKQISSKQLNALREVYNWAKRFDWHYNPQFTGRLDPHIDPASNMDVLKRLLNDANIKYTEESMSDKSGNVYKFIRYDLEENADTIRTFLSIMDDEEREKRDKKRSKTSEGYLPTTGATTTSSVYTKATFDALVKRWETKLGENKHCFAKKGDAVTMRKYFFPTHREQKENEKDFFYFEILQDVQHDPKIIRKMMDSIEQWLKNAIRTACFERAYEVSNIKSEDLAYARTVFETLKHRFPFKIRTWKRTDSNWNGHEFDLMRKKEGTQDAYWCLKIMQVVSHRFPRCSKEIKRTRNWYLPPIKLSNVPPGKKLIRGPKATWCWKKTDSWTVGDLVLQTTTNTGFSDRHVHVEELFTVHKVTPKTLCLFPVTIDEEGKVSLSKDVEDNRDTSKMIRVNKQEGRTLRGSQSPIRYFKYEYYDYHAKQTHVLRRHVEGNP